MLRFSFYFYSRWSQEKPDHPDKQTQEPPLHFPPCWQETEQKSAKEKFRNFK